MLVNSYVASMFRRGLLFLSALILVLPAGGFAQVPDSDPTRAPIPLEALLSRGHQSAVRVLAHVRIQLGPVSDRSGSGEGRIVDVVNIGSGVRFGAPNRVLTALTVVAGADSIEVQIGSRRMPAMLLGTDPDTGLALLSVNELLSSNEPPPPAPQPSMLGDVVLLVDPLGERTILHGGEVNAVLPTGLIFTTLPIYGGLSGAPLLNPRGEVVGIVAFAGSAEPAQAGADNAVAVTADLAARVATELEQFGRVRWGYFGAEADPTRSDQIVLRTVDEGSPAALAGLQSGDIVTHYGGERLRDPLQLRELVLTTVPGTAVPVRAMRDTAMLDVTIVVGDRRVGLPRQSVTSFGLRTATDMAELARWRELVEGFNRLFTMPGYELVRPSMTSLLLRLEQDLYELERATRVRRPPPH